MSLTDVGKIAN